jgi:glycosyltransferase involved in cell wall biosynthesis
MVSYCIPCRDRLHHLKVTLPKTVKGILPSDEIIVLNYGSSDEIDEWMVSNPFKNVRYFKLVEENSRWQMSRAKNVAHRLSSRPYVCNLDCDNWVVPGVSEYIIENLAPGRIIAMPQEYRISSMGGRVALSLHDFCEIGGYDERFESWGYEVTDFLKRSTLLGWKILTFPSKFNQHIRHPDRERVIYKANTCIESCLINKQISTESIERGVLKPNPDCWGKANVIEISHQ